MKSGDVRPRMHARKGFTLVEILVSMVLLTLLMLVAMNIVNHTRGVWQRTTGKISAFRESRAAFESLTRSLAQATLNTYFDYVNSAGRSRAEVGSGFVPDKYVRQSELHFVTGQARTLVPNSPETFHPGHAVFFQAPLGVSSQPSSGDAQLANLLNATGYFVRYGSDAPWRPPFLDGITPTKNRYRLMQMLQDTSELRIYDQPLTAGNRFNWFQTPLAASPSPARPLGENILVALFHPMKAANDVGQPLTADYTYDTKAYLQANAALSRNQLPPMVKVTLVALDEVSAARLEAKHAGGAPLLQPGALFTVASEYERDMQSLLDFLNEERLTYRVFTTNVPIRQAKFSDQ